MSGRGVRVIDDTGGFQQWYSSVPFVTRQWLTLTLLTTVLCNLSVIPIQHVIWDFSLVKEQFQIWRFVTSFLFVGKFSFHTAIAIFLLYQFSRQYEDGGVYNTGGGGGTADYIYMLMFGMVLTLLSTAFVDMIPIYSKNMVYYVLYVWSKRHPTSQVNLWGVPMKATMLPFATLALTVLMGNPWLDMAHGMVMGHVFYFLVDVVPVVYGKDYLHTPQFLIDQFGTGEYVAPIPGVVATPAGGRPLGAMGANAGQRRAGSGTSSSGYNWGGSGRTLGRD